MNPVSQFLNIVLLLLFSLVFPICISFETITQNQPLKDDGQTLVSYQKTFALGFFSPENSNRRYVGIWYNQIIEQTVVWVANRDNPLYDKSGVLSINGQGNLVLHTQNQSIPIWSTNVSTSALPTNNSMAKLLEVGNHVLLQQDSQTVIWQSFDYPKDTMLPFMKLGLDLRTGLNRYLTSWKSKDDPGTGNYSYRIYGVLDLGPA
nr:g-type lectin s-receptor-like serine/threonine-protein kinase rks1 [Quercus suber]